MEISPDGLFMEMWCKNRKGEKVYPFLKRRRGGGKQGFDVTPTVSRKDYELMDLEEFLDYLATDSHREAGRMRMRPAGGGPDGGFAIRSATMSQQLLDELARRKTNRG